MKRSLDIEDLIVSILTSRTMAYKVIDDLDLKGMWNKKYNMDAKKRLRNMTKIGLEKNGIIKLTVRDRSPELANKIVNAYIGDMDYFNAELGISAERKIVQIIDRPIIAERASPRGILKYTALTILISFISSVFLLAFKELTGKRQL